MQIVNIPYCSEDSTHESPSSSNYLLDLTQEDGDEINRKKDEEKSKSSASSPVTVVHKSTLSPSNSQFWNVARLSIDREFSKSISPIPILGPSPSSANIRTSTPESFTHRLTPFYRQNEPDSISKHFHYILNRHTSQPLDCNNRMSTVSPSPELLSRTQSQSNTT